MTVCILNAPTASEAGSVTVTTHVAVFPLNVFTVITALPADTAVILPLESKMATLVLPEVMVVPALAQFSPISAVSAKVFRALSLCGELSLICLALFNAYNV